MQELAGRVDKKDLLLKVPWLKRGKITKKPEYLNRKMHIQ